MTTTSPLRSAPASACWPDDWLAVHLDVRNHMFETDLLGSSKPTKNLQASFGVTAFF